MDMYDVSGGLLEMSIARDKRKCVYCGYVFANQGLPEEHYEYMEKQCDDSPLNQNQCGCANCV